MKMISEDISQYLVAPKCSFPLKKHSFLKYPIPEIPDDFENKSGTDRVLKKTSGSGRVSATRWTLLLIWGGWGNGGVWGPPQREGLRANSSVRISSCVTSYWLNSLWHSHQVYLACSKLWWYGWRTAHCVNTVVKVEDWVRQSHWLLKWSPCDIYMLREGVKKKKRFFLGLCPKHWTPPTHRARLELH